MGQALDRPRAKEEEVKTPPNELESCVDVVNLDGPLAEPILPRDVLCRVMLLVDFGSILSFSLTDKQNMHLLQEEHLWKSLAERDFAMNHTPNITNWREAYKNSYWLPPDMDTILKVASRTHKLGVPPPSSSTSGRLRMRTALVGISTRKYWCRSGYAMNRLSLLGARFKFREGFLEEAPPSTLCYNREFVVSDTVMFELWEMSNQSHQRFSRATQFDTDIDSIVFYYSPLLPKSFTFINNHVAKLQALRKQDRFYKLDVTEGRCDPKYIRTEQRRVSSFWCTPMVIVELRCERKYLSEHQYVEHNEDFIVGAAKGLARKLGCPYVVANNTDLGSVDQVFVTLEREYRKINSISKLGAVELGGKGAPIDPSLHLGKNYSKQDVKIED